MRRLKESDERRAGDGEKQMEDRPVHRRQRLEDEMEDASKGSDEKKGDCRIRILKTEENDGVSEYANLCKNRLIDCIYY